MLSYIFHFLSSPQWNPSISICHMHLSTIGLPISLRSFVVWDISSLFLCVLWCVKGGSDSPFRSLHTKKIWWIPLYICARIRFVCCCCWITLYWILIFVRRNFDTLKCVIWLCTTYTNAQSWRCVHIIRCMCGIVYACYIYYVIIWYLYCSALWLFFV